MAQEIKPLELTQGTREEHIDTLRRAKANGMTSVWSGTIRVRPYLHENLIFAEREGIISIEAYDNREAQESGWTITWLDHPEVP